MAKIIKGQHLSQLTEFKKGIIPWNKNKRGGIPWNKGLRGIQVAWNKGIGKQFTCSICNISFCPKAQGRYSKFCSNKCKGLGNRGRNNKRWKGGLRGENYAERRRFRSTMQKLIFERDNYTCQMCDSKQDLQVDHIQSWAKFKELRFDSDNCRTLCAKCHYKITFGREMPETTKAWGHNLGRRIVI